MFGVTFISMSIYDYPNNILTSDHDLKYWIYTNNVKKLTCSPKTYRLDYDRNYTIEYSFSKNGQLIEERYYSEFIGNTSITDTIALSNDGHNFYDDLGISHKRYLLKGDLIRQQRLFDKNGNLVFCFYRYDGDDKDFLRGKILTKSIKYLDGKNNVEILDFGFMHYNEPYFDTTASVILKVNNSKNLISVSGWVKDPIEQDRFDIEQRRELFSEQNIVDTVNFDFNTAPYFKEKIIEAFGRDFRTLFGRCVVTKYFNSNGAWFSRSGEYRCDDYIVLNAFSHEYRFMFGNSDLDSTLILNYGLYPYIKTVNQNEIGKVTRGYSIYGHISKNPPELNYYDQYDGEGRLIELYDLSRSGWRKTRYEYDGDLIKKYECYRQLPDSTIDSTSYTRIHNYQSGSYQDVHYNNSNCDNPKSLTYVPMLSNDFSKYSRINFVGTSRDTITNFIVGDSSNRIYTVEYWE